MRHVSYMLLLERSTNSQRLWVYRIKGVGRQNLLVVRYSQLLSHVLTYRDVSYINVKRNNRTIGPATRCDEIDHFAAIWRVLEASQPIAGLSFKIAAVWPVCYP